MKKFDVAAYIWPSYHYEPRVEHFWPEKDCEWYTVRRGTSRFPGHDMPRIPLLGCQDEADPAVMRTDTHWDRPRDVLWSGQVDRKNLEPMFDRIVDNYLSLDCYYMCLANFAEICARFR